MDSDLFITAIKNGEYISVDKFKPGDGESCDCICPDCGHPVRSNITSKSPDQLNKTFTNHFSHINKYSTCGGGYKETEIHLFAKSVIEKTNTILVPSNQYHYPHTINYHNVVLEKAFPIQECKQYRPDIIITTNENEEIAIEIVVTNDLSNEKRGLYKVHEFKCFKIDLTAYYKKDIQKINFAIESDILQNSKIKEWIWPKVLNELDEPVVNNTKTSPYSGSPSCLVSLFWLISFISLLCWISVFLLTQ